VTNSHEIFCILTHGDYASCLDGERRILLLVVKANETAHNSIRVRIIANDCALDVNCHRACEFAVRVRLIEDGDGAVTFANKPMWHSAGGYQYPATDPAKLIAVGTVEVDGAALASNSVKLPSAWRIKALAISSNFRTVKRRPERPPPRTAPPHTCSFPVGPAQAGAELLRKMRKFCEFLSWLAAHSRAASTTIARVSAWLEATETSRLAFVCRAKAPPYRSMPSPCAQVLYRI
jgi:hypothetical protein